MGPTWQDRLQPSSAWGAGGTGELDTIKRPAGVRGASRPHRSRAAVRDTAVGSLASEGLLLCVVLPRSTGNRVCASRTEPQQAPAAGEPRGGPGPASAGRGVRWLGPPEPPPAPPTRLQCAGMGRSPAPTPRAGSVFVTEAGLSRERLGGGRQEGGGGVASTPAADVGLGRPHPEAEGQVSFLQVGGRWQGRGQLPSRGGRCCARCRTAAPGFPASQSVSSIPDYSPRPIQGFGPPWVLGGDPALAQQLGATARSSAPQPLPHACLRCPGPGSQTDPVGRAIAPRAARGRAGSGLGSCLPGNTQRRPGERGSWSP